MCKKNRDNEEINEAQKRDLLEALRSGAGKKVIIKRRKVRSTPHKQ